MRLELVYRRLAGRVAGQPGWAQDPLLAHQLCHAATGVRIMVFRTEISVVFTNPDGGAADLAVSASTRFFPEAAIVAAAEVARALVLARTSKPAGTSP